MRTSVCVFGLLLALFGPVSSPEAASLTHGSVGRGHGIQIPGQNSNPCTGTLYSNWDGSAENGYCWQYGGVVPPQYGAFAECYSFTGNVCGIELNLTGIGYPTQPATLFVWADGGGMPGTVIAQGTGTPSGVPLWPSVAPFDFPMSATVAGVFWAGYWANFSQQGCGYFIAADLNGFGGCPMTDIAPGIGYPTGWNNVSVVWGPTQALGISVWNGWGLPPTGACCLEDGECVETGAGDCPGRFLGYNTSCDPNPCAQPPLGACCEAGGNCGVTFQFNCASGNWLVGAPCDPNPCRPSAPPPLCLDYAGYPQWLGRAPLPGTEEDVAVQGNLVCVADSAAGLYTLDVRNPHDPRVLGHVATAGNAHGVALIRSIACVAEDDPAHSGEGVVELIDLSNAQDPEVLGRVATPGAASGVAVSGNYAFVTAGGFLVIDISNPQSPRIVSSVDTVGYGSGVTVAGAWAYASGFLGLEVIDVTDPLNPRPVGTMKTALPALDVAVSGGQAYVADGYSGLEVVDVSNPRVPGIIGAVPTAGRAQSVGVSGTSVYVAEGGAWAGLQVVDVSNPQNPRIVDSIETQGPGCYGVGLSEGLVFFAYQGRGDHGPEGGLLIVSATGSRPVPVVARMNTPGFYLLDLAVAGRIVYAAEMCTYDCDRSRLQLIDVADPANPRNLGSVPVCWIQSVSVQGNYAYVAGYVGHDQCGLIVVNVDDPLKPRIVGSVILPSPEGTGPVVVSGNYAYVMAIGLQVVDISNPREPRVTGSVGYWEWPSCGLAVSGTHAYVTAGGLSVVDISDPTNPTTVGNVSTPTAAGGVVVAGGYAYVAATSELDVLDISNPSNPVITGSAPTPNGADAVALSGSHAYLAANGNGFCVVDISNPRDPRTLGGDSAENCPDLAVSGDYIYTSFGDGLQILPAQCEAASGLIGAAGLPATTWLSVSPNPARGETTIRLALRDRGPVGAAIFDVAGRRVRGLQDGELGAGVYDFPWNGRDDAGRQVMAGIYLARVSTAAGTRTTRVVFLR